MKARLNLLDHEAIKPMLKMEESIASSGLETSLIKLIKMRSSQINGCAFCLDMHSKEARKHGETEQRLYLLDAWRESPAYSERERAALAWTESLTLIAETHAPDSVYEELKRQFTEEEIVKLSMLIVTINGWNRLAIGFRSIHPVAPDSVAA
ncbi:carboxymuconolactone decarboxylase family protein [Phyllobacterium lublinensis]|uniref:carboxymuconolactone decarboxylase family protein n=1 Tax=Phyllobacterium lublinensis TaxID=2875708 RepID=UPI00351CEEA9